MQVLRGVVGSRMLMAAALSCVLTMTGCAGNDSSSSGGSNATATPTFSPGAGTYNTSQTVTVADSTPGAVLYCTTDGSMPTTSSPRCSQPTTIFQTQFLQAIAVAPNKAASSVASAGYTINLNAAATPSFSPDGGTYTGAQQVTISDATAGANIYYTLDGSAPGPNSLLYSSPVTISKNTTLSAIAIASGFTNSGVRSAGYTISNGPAAPVISPAGGSFATAQTVAITDATPNASIYYTTDGSTPTQGSTLYSGTFAVSGNQTVSAIAIAGGVNSTVTKAVFTINLPPAATPTFNPAAGTYTTAQQVTLSDATQGAVIYYTTDGSTPTASSTQYSGTPINVGSSETIKAIATASGSGSSAVASAAYTISVTVPAPTFSPAAGTFNAAQQVTLSDTDANAILYYTVDGSTPTASSKKYTTPISVSSTQTLNAIAVDGNATSTITTAAYTINAGPSYSGKVMSGTSAVAGATVQIYAAGNTGYASTATPLATTAATTGADGSFTLTYNCPAAPGDLVYIVATGGHTGSDTASNAGLALMAALGACNSALPMPLMINEVTTVASAYALSPFMSGATNVGSSSTNYEAGTNGAPGLFNAFATVGTLVDLTTGMARTHTPDYATDLSGDANIVNNSVVPQARINTLADILNTCAAGSGCSSLFGAATPQSGTAPADTLQAILNIAQNPGNNAGTVYNVAAGAGPFTPALSAAPNDWTLAITYTGGGLGFAPDLQLPSAFSPFSDGRLVNTAMAIDATGNIWVTGLNTSRTLAASTDLNHGMVAKFDNQGKPLTPASSYSSSGTVTFGGYSPQGIAAGLNGGTVNPQSLAIDPSGNAWVLGGSGFIGDTTTGGNRLTEVTPTLSLAIPSVAAVSGALTPAPLLIDGLGNLWLALNGLTEFNSSGTQLSTDAGMNPPGSPFGYAYLASLVFDSNATSLWSSSDSAFGDLYQTDAKTNTATFDYFTTNTGVFTNLVAGSALPDGSPGNVYGCATDGQSLSVFNVSSTAILATYPISTGRGCGRQMVMDGAGHIFAVSGGSGNSITPGIIDVLGVGSSGVSIISPSTGYTGVSSGEAATINADSSAPLPYDAVGSGYTPVNGGVAGTAIDGSGNLWVLNVDTGTDTSKGNVLVKFIGLAAPVVTPNSLALQFGQVGVRP